MTDAGFEIVSNEYVLRETVNKKEGLCVPRVFVQGKFVKPEVSTASIAPVLFPKPEPVAVDMPSDLNNSNNELGTVT